MRNLAEFPITAEEVRQTIQRQIDKLNGDGDPTKMIVGGVQGVIWNALLSTLDIQLDKDLTVMDVVLNEMYFGS